MWFAGEVEHLAQPSRASCCQMVPGYVEIKAALEDSWASLGLLDWLSAETPPSQTGKTLEERIEETKTPPMLGAEQERGRTCPCQALLYSSM